MVAMCNPKKIRMAATLAMLTLPVAGPALAQDTGTRIAVRTDDLNLATQQGIAVLHHRLVRAARQVCGIEYGHQVDLSDMTQCYAPSLAHRMADEQVFVARAESAYLAKVASK